MPLLQPNPDLFWTVLKSIFFLLTLVRIPPLWKQKNGWDLNNSFQFSLNFALVTVERRKFFLFFNTHRPHVIFRQWQIPIYTTIRILSLFQVAVAPVLHADGTILDTDIYIKICWRSLDKILLSQQKSCPFCCFSLLWPWRKDSRLGDGKVSLWPHMRVKATFKAG